MVKNTELEKLAQTVRENCAKTFNSEQIVEIQVKCILTFKKIAQL